eukprot:TCALIF_06431-PA protein Name:"Similar to SCP2 Non-specific lipid-transfer protein (Oryctolagus cuniculus)" AED:0.10 eAED:0.10 QI:44/1/1/1/1/1/8/130/503
MVKESVGKALVDAQISYDQIEQAAVGYVYGDSTSGQRALYECGLSGIPIFNVNNNCSTGSSALFLAQQAIAGGSSDCTLAVGFEKMKRGSLGLMFDDRTNPIDKHVEVLMNVEEIEPSPMAAQMFGAAGREHMKKYGTKREHFAKIAEKNHRHSVNNPNSQFRDEYTLRQVLESPKVYDPLTKLQCCPTSDGSAAAILASKDFVIKHKLENQAVEILGMEMATDFPSSFNENSCIKMIGFDMTQKAARKLFQKTGLKPEDVDVIELHDCFSTNELITYEALGLCPIGKAGQLVDNGDNTYGGKFVINPSGGLISKGHPLGATGLAQCTELCLQVRGQADKRQVQGAQIALQHNLGLGGAVVVALYKMGFQQTNGTSPQSDGSSGFKSRAIFDGIAEALSSDGPNLVKKVKGIFAFKVKGSDGTDGTWIVDAKNGSGAVEFGGKAKPDVTLTLKDEDLVDLMLGKLNAQKAFFQGKLKIQGNMGLAMKLQEFQKQAGEQMKAKL